MSFAAQREKIIAAARVLLDEGGADAVLAWGTAEPDGRAVPRFFRQSGELPGLRFDAGCTPNLAKYALNFEGKLGIVMKPCDTRMLSVYLSERQLGRETLYVIAPDCGGMVRENGCPAPGCDGCARRTPVLFDLRVPAEEEPSAVGGGQEVRGQFTLDRFRKETEKCILCFACRQACFGCYCKTCFMERGAPDWLPAGPALSGKMFFHLGRAMHLAGRCVGCGACERVCPAGVRLRYLGDELARLGQSLYGESDLLNCREDDPQQGFWEETQGGEGHGDY